jgi:hypothetical protein
MPMATLQPRCSVDVACIIKHCLNHMEFIPLILLVIVAVIAFKRPKITKKATIKSLSYQPGYSQVNTYQKFSKTNRDRLAQQSRQQPGCWKKSLLKINPLYRKTNLRKATTWNRYRKRNLLKIKLQYTIRQKYFPNQN